MVSRIFATEQAEDLASLEKVLELLRLKILSYPEEQRDRYSEFIVRWLNNHLLASDINIQLSRNLNLTVEQIAEALRLPIERVERTLAEGS